MIPNPIRKLSTKTMGEAKLWKGIMGKIIGILVKVMITCKFVITQRQTMYTLIFLYYSKLYFSKSSETVLSLIGTVTVAIYLTFANNIMRLPE